MSRAPAHRRLLAELKRRNVLRVAATYGAAAFVMLQAADLVFPRIGLTDRAVTLVVWLAIIGFPIALVLSWIYELRPEGVAPKHGPASAELEAIAAEPRRRRWPAGLLALAGMALLAAGAWLALRPPDLPGSLTSPDAEESRVAVLPFSVSGSPTYAYLESGMVDLLSTRMDGIGSIRTVPARAVLGLVRQEASDVLDQAGAERIASALAAGRYVTGRVVESGGRLEITAVLYRPGAAEPVTEAAVDGSAEDLFGLVDRLTTQLVARSEGSPGGRVSQLAALTTGSLPALKAYLAGEEQFRRGQFTPAQAAFEEATSIDTTFALAHYRLSVAREWGGQGGAIEAADRAARFADRLSARDRLLVDALRTFRHGDGERAEELYRTVLGTWPDDVEAWFQLAEVLNHNGPQRGRSISESRQPFERVLRYEPDHLASWWHLARIEAIEGRLEALDDAVDRIRRLSPAGDRNLELLALRAAKSRPDDWRWVVDSLAIAQDYTLFTAIWNVAVYGEDIERGSELADMLDAPTRSAEVRATGNLLSAFFALARGRPAQADAALARVAELDRSLALTHAAALDLLPFAEPSRAELAAHARALAEWDAEPGCRSDHPVRYFEPGTCIRPLLRTYLLGMLDARLGQPARAAARAAELEKWPAAEAEGHGREFAADIRAEIALQRRDMTAALAALEAAPGHVWYTDTMQSFFYCHSPVRFRLAQLLEAAGRRDEAVRWYDSFDEMSPWDLVLQGPAQLRAGALLESLGRRAEALAHYRRAVRLLGGGTGSFAELARQAQAGIGRIGD
jgi:tetratricopeptide (TPR) repeat protein